LDALESFRDGKTDYLLATDVAARGLDIMGIETVINFTMPSKLNTYIHRVGRTARAGEKGLSISLAGEDDRALLKQIIKYAKSKVKQRIVPADAVNECKLKIESLEEDVRAIHKDENAEREVTYMPPPNIRLLMVQI
jgi:ATP-dependent RNA helicase DDX27